MSTSNAVYAVLDTYPDDLRSLFLDLEPTPNPGEITPRPPLLETKVSEKKSSKKKAKRRRASIRARLHSYVRDYSVDLQSLFDDIVATASSKTESNNSTNPGEAEPQANQSESICLAVYGSQYLKERLELMLKRAKISVLPLTKKGSKKQRMKRKGRAKLLDKLNILRKQFQLLKKDDQSLEEMQKSSPSPAKRIKKVRKKRKKKPRKKSTKKTNKTETKTKTRQMIRGKIKINKRQGIRRRLGSVG